LLRGPLDFSRAPCRPMSFFHPGLRICSFLSPRRSRSLWDFQGRNVEHQRMTRRHHQSSSRRFGDVPQHTTFQSLPSTSSLIIIENWPFYISEFFILHSKTCVIRTLPFSLKSVAPHLFLSECLPFPIISWPCTSRLPLSIMLIPNLLFLSLPEPSFCCHLPEP